MTKKTNQKKPLNKAMQLSGAGLQMGLTIYLGFLLGEWLDKKFAANFLTETVTLLAIFLAMYSLIKQANKIND
ncbi:AtpZ/AtpI family protein [Polaribacter sp. Z014]|uniref:AtpZ/AtpI family protein n=1 Tax=unclassified Polaribacter TaxID=196858 RepID=UPI00193AF1BE|nr:MULTISPECIES: AtpZ/AtpI family protein [unclassified Polaribacter]MCL7762180.1 AtpZ/AtpI family protein [Polaribacter sp. Z014]QVY64394.1 AtpZ/AtpI family protein [Polaribacter sp. Q13]